MTSGNRCSPWLRRLTVSTVFTAVALILFWLLSGLLNYTGTGLSNETYQAQFPATHAFFLTLQLMLLLWGTIISIGLAAAAGYLTHRALKNNK